MTTEIKIGSRVTAPITDKDGEVEHIIGTLVSINSRFAKVDTGEKIVSVGKTKIESMEPVKTKRKPRKIECPECGGVGRLEPDSEFGAICENEECGHEWEEEQERIADGYEYRKTTAASGRASVDNGDETAQLLRGKELDEVYIIASEITEMSISELKGLYQHLNPGHQRMCLGNRIRGILRNQ